MLVVEDDLEFAKILLSLAKEKGYMCILAADGNTALQMASEFKPDGVLLDIGLPGMSGLEVASNLMGDNGMSTASIMMLTSTMKHGYNADCKRAGIQKCLLKPIRKDDLHQAIIDILLAREDNKFLKTEEPGEKEATTADKSDYKVIRILAADDSSDNRFLLTAFLKGFSCELTIKEDGQEALDAFKSNQYDIVLMDMQMPVLDGFAATRLIREWESENNLSNTPILALTAYALPEEIKHCTNAGCDGHISKPVRKKKLIQAIKDFVK